LTSEPARLHPHVPPDEAEISVLVAEDDAAVREALTELVEMHPRLRLVAAVVDAWAAVEAAARDSPDVVIVDVRMPGGGGAWATREIRRLSPTTQVIAFSGSTDLPTMEAMREAGASGYLVKGSSLTTILEAIEQAATSRSRLGAQ
jgi:DNA-binding NarL/FixJ family response regulator